jgi:hypothetical protein
MAIVITPVPTPPPGPTIGSLPTGTTFQRLGKVYRRFGVTGNGQSYDYDTNAIVTFQDSDRADMLVNLDIEASPVA